MLWAAFCVPAGSRNPISNTFHMLQRSAQHKDAAYNTRSEEHTSELQSHLNLVCRLLNDTATTEIYTLSLHDALPICQQGAEILFQIHFTCFSAQRNTKMLPII